MITARASLVVLLCVGAAVAGGRSLSAGQADADAESRALVQRLTLDHAATMVAIQKKSDLREQEVFAELASKDRRLRLRERELRQEALKRSDGEAELKAVVAELETVTAERQRAVDAVAEGNRQFATEIAEYRRQILSIAGSPDPRKRAQLKAYADGERQRAFAVLVDIQRAEEKAVAAGWRELGALAIDLNDRGELDTAGVIDVYERAQRADPTDQWGWVELTRLYIEAGRLADAKRAALAAADRATDERARAVANANVGRVLWATGDLAEARRRLEESTAGFRRLWRASRDSKSALSDLIVVLQGLSDFYDDTGDLAAALRHASEILSVTRGLAAADPADLETQREVGQALERLGNLLLEAGDLTKAQEYFADNLVIARRAAGLTPGSHEVLRDLSSALVRMGEALTESGDLRAAQARYEEAETLVRKSAAADPSNAMAQRDLAVILGRLGDVALGRSNFKTGYLRLEEGLAISRRLAAENPTDVKGQIDVSFSLTKLAQVFESAGDTSGARTRLEESLRITRGLVAANPNHAEAQRALSISLNLLAPLLAENGEFTAARPLFDEYLQIVRRAAAANPASAVAQRDLSVGLTNVARTLLKVGDEKGARGRLEQSFEIRQRLATANPANAQAQLDLLGGHLNLADLPGGEAHLTEARRLAEALLRAGALSRRDQLYLDAVRKPGSKSR